MLPNVDELRKWFGKDNDDKQDKINTYVNTFNIRTSNQIDTTSLKNFYPARYGAKSK
jgi:hypothetical protein